MKLRNIPFRMESEFFKRFYRKRGLRPTSAPYLSGDSFRNLTPWRWEGKTGSNLVLDHVPDGAVVFVEAWHLKAALEALGSQRSRTFCVVSANGDPNFTAEKLTWIPANVTRLWVQNLLTVDPRLSPLPIGLENAVLHTNGIVRDFDQLRRCPLPSTNRVLWGFAEGTNPRARGAARLALSACGVADRLTPVNARAYRKTLSRYRFVASPPGNGEDCHRTWEALYLRVVPIVIRSPLTETFRSWGLPVWLVDSYDELTNLTESDLAGRYQEFRAGFDNPKLWMASWKQEFGL